jgi:mRNA-degrading endonuclease toxin of MazEF toxin-antitoxin module
MTTDPGDLVLDPTCGSGTTGFVAEQWGRRWITVDTSRVALALARPRLLTSRFDSEVLLTPADGMPQTCAINLDHLQTVQRAKVGALITTLKPEKLDQVRTAMLFALGFRAT